MKKIILDCDTGIDDALAIAYLLGKEDIEVLGIVASYGNTYMVNAYRNTSYLVEKMKKNVPVYKGSKHPLTRGERVLEEKDFVFHGKDGLANILGQVESSYIKKGREEEGIDFIIEMAERYAHELTLITVGPMTDLALAFRKNPDSIRKIGQVVSMIGALATPGNCSDVAEANALCDPQAAKEVFEASLPVQVVGLDVTHKVQFNQDDLKKWEKIDSPLANDYVRMMRYYLGSYKDEHSEIKGCAMHDPLAAAIALCPEWSVMVPMHLTCVIEGPLKGRITEDTSRVSDDNYRSQGVFWVDKVKYKDEMLKVISQNF